MRMNQFTEGSSCTPFESAVPMSATPAAPRKPGRSHLSIVPPQRLADAGEDGVLQQVEIGPLDLELGGHLPAVTMAYRTWGRLNAAGDNAVIVLHALTGDSKAAGDGGWWDPLIGPGRAIDTSRQFVICANLLGGCQGSTGPTSIDPLTSRPYAMRFPLVTIGDMVTAQRRLVEQLGITRLVAIGGSIGGFQALEWASRHPDLVSASVPIASTPSLGPQGIALNEAGRRAIIADPAWRGGEYCSEGIFPADGLAIARMIAMVTFHSRESMDMRFARKPATRPSLYPSFGGTFDVEGYIHYHGAALVRRFDANSHLYLTRAMDLYDFARDGGESHWIDKIAAPMLLVGIRSDWLFPPDAICEFTARVVGAGKEAEYAELDSPHGHDAFLKEWDRLTDVLSPFMARIAGGA